MVDRNLIREFNVNETDLENALGDSLNDWANDDASMDVLYDERARWFDVNKTVSGTIIRIDGEDVLVDIGYKSEGIVPLEEWSDSAELPKPGEKVDVLLEEVEDDFGLILLSKRKADRMREWEKVIQSHKEGDVVKGKVVRKIKGGLLVNIGVNVFLPASQVDIRRPPDIGDYIGRTIQCVVLKIDEQRRNIVVSRRELIEDRRAEKKKQAARGDRAGPAPQGHGQEHRRVRRVRRPGRHRRPAAHHRHELGPHRPSLGNGQDRPGDRGEILNIDREQGKDRPGAEAEDAPALGAGRRASTRSAPRSRGQSSTS